MNESILPTSTIVDFAKELVRLYVSAFLSVSTGAHAESQWGIPTCESHGRAAWAALIPWNGDAIDDPE